MADSVDLEVTEQSISENLYTRDLPDPDLVVRTSGEMRLSNFLLWQLAYAEIYVTQTLWPDFRGLHLLEGIEEYQKRERPTEASAATPATHPNMRPCQPTLGPNPKLDFAQTVRIIPRFHLPATSPNCASSSQIGELAWQPYGRRACPRLAIKMCIFAQQAIGFG